MKPIHDSPPCLFKIRFNIFLASAPVASERSLSTRFYDGKFVWVSHLLSALLISDPFIILVIFGAQFLIKQCSAGAVTYLS
jgi:hypothetical protein